MLMTGTGRDPLFGPNQELNTRDAFSASRPHLVSGYGMNRLQAPLHAASYVNKCIAGHGIAKF